MAAAGWGHLCEERVGGQLLVCCLPPGGPHGGVSAGAAEGESGKEVAGRDGAPAADYAGRWGA